MLYGDEKSLQMARSLLPSQWREKARQHRTHASRSTRRTVRVHVARMVSDPDFFEGCAEVDADSTVEMRQMVNRRRQSDKVSPFLRWAKHRTADEPRDSRLSRIRGVVPEGLIGAHALDHLRGDEHFMSTAELASWEARRWVSQNRWRSERGVMAQLLRRLLRIAGGQKAFNGYLKRASAKGWSKRLGHDGRRHTVFHGDDSLRLLMGVHDVLPFLDAIEVHARTPRDWSRPQRPASTRVPALDFLRAFHRHTFDLGATLRSLPVPKLTNLPA
ncbi:hypothetical protein LXT21_11130 [Myxococcus sp. K38C18041901]|uniref:hypothetical protein n=1 Tax=Myxococcus guangdongensis TaxID=2906760 RepID=UPI0020A6ED5F|nr:hypothetical protein [Myxococcus guangdongensis]MCP3059326.1 hypothetical protein [Myxococcus guangdongensis]